LDEKKTIDLILGVISVRS